jgi:hypothetical protein
MKIRTTEQLIEAVAGEIAWRRRELTDLRFLVESVEGNRTREAVVTRAAVALLYAHWEGFVKAAAEIYLQFVAMQRCRNSELTDSMLAIALRSKLQAAQGSKKITIHTTVVEFFRTQMQKQSSLPYKDVVCTEANLSSTVLLEILRSLGLSTEDYESKSHLIDSHLLAKRNHIAHGSALSVETKDYLTLHDEIVNLISLFRNQIENAAVTRGYLLPGEIPTHN